MMVGSWLGQLEPRLDDQVVAILGVDDYIMRRYMNPAQPPVGLYVGYYSSQRQGDSIHSPLNCLPGAGWEPLEQSRIRIPVRGAFGRTDTLTPIEVNRVVIAKGLDRELVLYWYQSHQRVVASEYWGKIFTVLDSIRYNRTDAALVRLTTNMSDGDASAAERRVVAFTQEIFPRLAPYLPS
jgi:EpsI family protein